MRLLRSNSLAQRRVSWLLALVLLLPLAQMAASWHLLSHAAEEQTSASSDHGDAIHEGHCELCLTAAAVVGGALPVQSFAAAPPAALADLLPGQIGPVWFTRQWPPFESRAPPFTLI